MIKAATVTMVTAYRRHIFGLHCSLRFAI